MLLNNTYEAVDKLILVIYGSQTSQIAKGTSLPVFINAYKNKTAKFSLFSSVIVVYFCKALYATCLCETFLLKRCYCELKEQLRLNVQTERCTDIDAM